MKGCEPARRSGRRRIAAPAAYVYELAVIVIGITVSRDQRRVVGASVMVTVAFIGEPNS